MPSHQHEVLLLLFHNRPELAADLLRDVLHVNPPPYVKVHIGSAELGEISPVQYQADLVVILEDQAPVLGIVVEVQLTPDQDKRFVWPVYATNLRARLKCPVCLLVVTADDGVARWAARPIELGAGNQFVPLVLGPSGVPEVTDAVQASADPELAVLSSMAHGMGADVRKAVQIALVAEAATHGLDENRRHLYFDLIWASLSEDARRELQMFDPAKFMREYWYQSAPARRWFADGQVEGRAALVSRLLAVRYGPLTEEVQERIRTAAIAELDAIAERLLTASTLQEALGQR